MSFKSLFSSRSLNVLLLFIIFLLLHYGYGNAGTINYSISDYQLYLDAWSADTKEDKLKALILYRAFYYRDPDELNNGDFKKELDTRISSLESHLKTKLGYLDGVVASLKKCGKFPCEGRYMTIEFKNFFELPGGTSGSYGGPQDDRLVPPPIPPYSIILTKDYGYSGASTMYTLGEGDSRFISDLGNFNDQVSSIAIGDKVWVELFHGKNFSPPSIKIMDSMSDFSFFPANGSLHFQNSSLSVEDNFQSLVIHKK